MSWLFTWRKQMNDENTEVREYTIRQRVYSDMSRLVGWVMIQLVMADVFTSSPYYAGHKWTFIVSHHEITFDDEREHCQKPYYRALATYYCSKLLSIHRRYIKTFMLFTKCHFLMHHCNVRISWFN